MEIKKKFFELIYNNEKIGEFEYNETTKIAQIKIMISQKLKINNNYIKLFYNKKSLLEEDLISSILPQTTQIPNSKIKIQVIPQISLDIIPFKLKFIQIGNESNTFELCGDIFSKFSILKIEIFNFFQKIFTQFNQKIN